MPQAAKDGGGGIFPPAPVQNNHDVTDQAIENVTLHSRKDYTITIEIFSMLLRSI